MRLLEVVVPGLGGECMAIAASETRYRKFNEFLLGDQSKWWAAFEYNI